MKKGLIVVMILLSYLQAFAGAAPDRKATTTRPTPLKQAASIPSQPWQREWEKTVASAKAEGTLVIYTSIRESFRADIRKAFREKYGMDIEWIVGRSAELLAKLKAERRAGLLLGDFLISGADTHVELKKDELLSPVKPLLLLPEVLDSRVYYQGKLPFLLEKDENYTLIFGLYTGGGWFWINTELVKPGEIKGWEDLLDSKWKGKIIFSDPTVPGAGSAVFNILITKKILTSDYFRQLAKQEPVILRDERLHAEWLAKGKYPVSIGLGAITYEFTKVGAPIKRVFPGGGALAMEGISFLERAPHPSAAKVFVNWLMTSEGLTLYSKAELRQSSRNDVPTDFLDPENIRQPGVKYPLYDGSGTAESVKLAREIFGHLLK